MKTKSTAHAEFAEKIKASWTKSVACILETARLCAEANERLDAREKATLIAELPFDASAFSKLAKIGADQRLDVAPIASLLPPSYSIIYAISQLSNSVPRQHP